jgi:hypothetical protein
MAELVGPACFTSRDEQWLIYVIIKRAYAA